MIDKDMGMADWPTWRRPETRAVHDPHQELSGRVEMLRDLVRAQRHDIDRLWVAVRTLAVCVALLFVAVLVLSVTS